MNLRKKAPKLLVVAVVLVSLSGFHYTYASVLQSDLNQNGISDSTESDVTVDSSSILPAGEYNFNNLTITNNSTLTLDSDVNSGNLFKGVKINANNLIINSGSSISANEKGYGYGAGPGAATIYNYLAGASYGGIGVGNYATSTYGSALEPLELGSGGTGSNPYGGGAIWLVVSNIISNNGVISADGGPSSSGGSIYITTSNLTGAGEYHANGGNNYCPNTCIGSGGGGRIAIYFDNSSFIGSANALAGYSCWYGCQRSGINGTVGFLDRTNNNLLINSSWRFQKNDSQKTFNIITIIDGAKVTMEEGAVTNANELLVDKSSSLIFSKDTVLIIPKVIVDNGSTLTLSGEETVNTENLFVVGTSTVTVIPEKILSLTISNISISAGSSISADSKGYIANSGPGTTGPINTRAGASYGGVGGWGGVGTYGSATKPTDFGSGGPYTGRGGGAIRLVVNGTLTNDGVISANGDGSSSGGSIYVTVNNMTGGGSFIARGGSYSSSSVYLGHGAGGRIAIYYQTSSFSGQATALGGCGSLGMGYPYECGGSGTAGLFDTTNNDLYVNSTWRFQKNDGPFVFNKIVVDGDAKLIAEEDVNIKANELLVDNNSAFTLSKGVILTVPKVTVSNRSTLTLSGEETVNTENLFVVGTSIVTVIPEKILSLTIPDITISSGSSILADGKGFSGGMGPGAPSEANYFAGASYGGLGEGNVATSTYGSETAPVDFGSAGNGYHNRGGGAIRLIATRTLNNDGIVSADGDNTSSGGSIYVTAGTMSGSGSFHTNGGGAYCPNYCMRTGGGGRIALYYVENLFVGPTEAKGGCISYDGWSRSCAGNGTVILKQSELPPPTQTCCSNVMFLPGIEASRLYKQIKVLGISVEDQLWEPNVSSDVTDLFLDVAGKSVRKDIYTKDVLDEINVLPVGQKNVYKSFLNNLKQWKENDKTIADYSVIPYDWRLSLDDILNSGNKLSDGRIYYSGDNSSTPDPYVISELRRLAADSKTGKVTVIAHSNGGLVVKALTDKLGTEASSLIDKIIFVAVPQTGTPQAIGALLHGYDQGLPFDWIPIILTPEVARQFAVSSQMTYNLLPSTQYFTYVNDPVVTFDDSVLLAPWRARYGKAINSSARLHDFISDQSRIALPVSDSLKFPISGKVGLLNNAEALHNTKLDNWTPPAGIKLSEIAGWGEKTLSTIEYYQGRKTYCTNPRDINTCTDVPALEYKVKEVMDGDGTVVVPSALWTSGADRYWVDLYDYNGFFTTDRKHADILEVPELHILIKSIIKNNTSTTFEYITRTAPINTNLKTRLRFTLHSPLSLDLYDEQGNHTGISNATGFIEENIPDSRYKTYGELKYIEVPASTLSHLVMNGNNTGSFTLDIDKEQGDVTIASTTFAAIPTLPTTIATIDITSNTEIGNSSLKIDQNGDGTVDKVLHATPDGVTVYDNIPPELQVSFDINTKDVVFFARDLSDPYPTILTTGKSTTLTDNAGNITVIPFIKYKEKSPELKLSFSKITRNGVSTIIPNTHIEYEWNEKKGILTDLDTKIIIKGEEKYVFSYKKEKNATIIKEKIGGRTVTTTKSGFIVVTVKTEGDSLKVSY